MADYRVDLPIVISDGFCDQIVGITEGALNVNISNNSEILVLLREIKEELVKLNAKSVPEFTQGDQSFYGFKV